LKLGEWQTLAGHLIPLFAAYREDREMTSLILKVTIHLTTNVNVHPMHKFTYLHYLQDSKEAFVNKNIFIILMGMLVESMEEEDAETQQKVEGEKKNNFEDILTLLCNLMCVPDPSPGDAGFTPMRRFVQLNYIKRFHEEGVLDFFLLFAEQLEQDRNAEQVWALLEIVYHIAANVDPEGLVKAGKAKSKRVLAELLERDQAHSRLNRTDSTRHSRFGFTLQKRDAHGGVRTTTSLTESSKVGSGSKIWNQQFKNSHGTQNKQNMFHDPFFVDMMEGSVREHNQINPHVKQSTDAGSDLGDAVLAGLRKFFEEFIQHSFSSLVSFARGTVLQTKQAAGGESVRQYGRQRLFNFVAWMLEFHRHHYFGEAAKAKENKEAMPTMDIASIQGGIDLDMIQFVTARLREYGKESHIHSSFLVLTLRALSQQVKTISVIIDQQDSETRDCGDILVRNFVKEDVMAHLCWIMKNFKSSAHDPRVLSYTVEIFHHMTRLMRKVMERDAANKQVQQEFHVERVFGAQLRRVNTTVEQEIESLADAIVVENLFHLLEKYKRHSASMNSMLVKLIYSIIRARPANIVVFFELSYFVRIHRMMSDPLVRDKKQGKQYHEMVELLRFILRQFFKCAERNKCVFVELLFRKSFVAKKEAMMDSTQSEFEAILTNYEDEGYAQFLERMRHGESFETMRTRQRQLESGNLAWTTEEDDVLKDRYSVFMDHPLCMELLAAELPEDSRRNPKGVKKRLVELGLLETKVSRNLAQDDAAPEPEFAEGSPSKKQKLMEDEPMFSNEDLDSLEMDLEKLLDAEASRRIDDSLIKPSAAASSSGLCGAASSSGDCAAAAAASIPQTMLDAEDGAQQGMGMDLELELEAMIDSGSLPHEEDCAAKTASLATSVPAQATLPGSAPMPATDTPKMDLEVVFEKESLSEAYQAELPSSAAAATLEDASVPSGSDKPTQASQAEPPATAASATLEDDLEALLEESGVVTQPTPTKTQLSQGGDDEEQFWEDAVQNDEVTGAKATQQLGSAPEEPASQGSAALGLSPTACLSQDSLALDLEKLIDEGEA
jgi:hypothetical protein